MTRLMSLCIIARLRICHLRVFLRVRLLIVLRLRRLGLRIRLLNSTFINNINMVKRLLRLRLRLRLLICIIIIIIIILLLLLLFF